MGGSLSIFKLIGAGASSSIAIQLGKGNKENAEKIIGTAFVMSVILSVLLSVFGIFFINVRLNLYGAGIDNIEFAREYMIILFGGALAFVFSQSMNNIVL